MGAQESKIKCLYLPAQSGKTRKMEDLIQKHKMGDIFEPVDINVIISANNRLLVEQTRTRMIRDLQSPPNPPNPPAPHDACIRGGIFSWMSGTSRNSISSVDLAWHILNDEIEMVVLCAHPRRLQYLVDALTRLENSTHFTKKINIWIDEADQSIQLWSRHSDVTTMACINQITLVSATFDSVMSKYKHLHVLPYMKTHPDCYRGLRDAKRSEVDFMTACPIEYVRHVLTRPENAWLTRPGVRAFIPGSNATSSHDGIADFLHTELGFLVVIINGRRKEILIPGEPSIDLCGYFTLHGDQIPSEFSAQIATLYQTHAWGRYPLAITGGLCVRRGVTFQCDVVPGVHEGFLFDYGIIPPMIGGVEGYQTMARLFGNIGHCRHYKPPRIFTGTATFSKIEKKEEIVMNLARLVYERGIEVVTPNDMKTALHLRRDEQYDLYTGEFTRLEEATRFMRDRGARGKTDQSLTRNAQGFILSSLNGQKTVLCYDKVVDELRKGGKTSNFDMRNATRPMGRLCVCYKDRTDPSSVVFIPRVLVPRQ